MRYVFEVNMLHTFYHQETMEVEVDDCETESAAMDKARLIAYDDCDPDSWNSEHGETDMQYIELKYSEPAKEPVTPRCDYTPDMFLQGAVA